MSISTSSEVLPTMSGYGNSTLLAEDNYTTVNDATTPLPLFGYPGSHFYIIHGVALVSLSISVLVSIAVLLHLICMHHVTFWQRPIGERLVVYLAICDVSFSISHIADHSYMLAVVDHPPDAPCAIMAAFLLEFIFAQNLIVVVIAFNAYIMVVKETKLELGRRDWRLLVFSFGFPALLVVILAAFQCLGPQGAWCLFDMRQPFGIHLVNGLSVVFISVFLINFTSYGMVWYKIKQTTNKSAVAAVGNIQKRNKYHKLARLLMLFVVVNIAQYWAYILMSAWSLSGVPHIATTILAVFFSNMGGVFNFIAYTYVRKRAQSVGPDDQSMHTRTTI